MKMGTPQGERARIRQLVRSRLVSDAYLHPKAEQHEGLVLADKNALTESLRRGCTSRVAGPCPCLSVNGGFRAELDATAAMKPGANFRFRYADAGSVRVAHTVRVKVKT